MRILILLLMSVVSGASIEYENLVRSLEKSFSEAFRK